MLGAIIGDIAGSRFEWDNIKTKDFELFDDRRCEPTDDSVMSLAIAKALMNCAPDFTSLKQEAVSCMQEFGKKYPHAGYGGSFKQWIHSRATVLPCVLVLVGMRRIQSSRQLRSHELLPK